MILTSLPGDQSHRPRAATAKAGQKSARMARALQTPTQSVHPTENTRDTLSAEPFQRAWKRSLARGKTLKDFLYPTENTYLVSPIGRRCALLSKNLKMLKSKNEATKSLKTKNLAWVRFPKRSHCTTERTHSPGDRTRQNRVAIEDAAGALGLLPCAPYVFLTCCPGRKSPLPKRDNVSCGLTGHFQREMLTQRRGLTRLCDAC